MIPFIILLIIFGLFIVISILRSIRIIPARTAVVVERLGKFNGVLEAGFHVLVPFIDKVRYTHSQKEQAIDVPTQPCITHDNVKVEVDGVLYFKVMDPQKASYGISDYRYGTIQLAQTTMRSVIGKLELDRTFEERDRINGEIVQGLVEATTPWGVQITRYEIQNIRVPENILQSMENQMRAEREKRAEIARSIGEMESKINYSKGIMEEAINKSEGEKERRINEAEGKAAEIKTLAAATAISIRKVAESLENAGGNDALFLQVTEDYLSEMKKIAKKDTRLIVPMDVTDIAGVIKNIKQLVEE